MFLIAYWAERGSLTTDRITTASRKVGLFVKGNAVELGKAEVRARVLVAALARVACGQREAGQALPAPASRR